MECNRKCNVEETIYAKWPCAVCKKGVGSSSVQCRKCTVWVHRRCSGVTGALNKVAESFVCSICSGQKTNKIITQYTDLERDVKLEKVSTFTYLGDKIQANGGAHEAVRNRIKTAWSVARSSVTFT